MARFVSFAFFEQSGDALVFLGPNGRQRLVPFNIKDMAAGRPAPHHVVCLTTGAWLQQNKDAEDQPLKMPFADNDVDALTWSLQDLKRHGLIFDQTMQQGYDEF